ncbi:unnamed protein product [Hymenolepis diminuta]|uniref:AN1-type domain-containing protein n=1 Tax=Hymenolepis diminuta TaxID=6216 RepID=A0A0R3S9W4_HYMDI|nr:unnamed protein product [Hymenolepis diminuta]VUZ49524.1 unnamed protein product [Hymenolepis diminuta]
MEDQDQTQSASRLCRQGCGYFGHAVFDGFCSQCHKRLQDAKNPSEPRTASSQEIVPKSQGSTGRSSFEFSPYKSPDDCPKVEISTAAVAEDPPTAVASEPKSKKHPRCLMCNKRVGLTGFTCRCGGLFCTVHRYSDAHQCQFDYRESGQADIRKANPQVISSKINKI